MIERVFTGLKAAGFDLDSEELADTLWLAACGLFPARSPEIASEVSAEKPPPETPRPVTPVPANPAPNSAPPAAPEKSKTETSIETESEGAAELVAPGIPNAADATPASALPLRTPAASGLPGALDLSRALRLLRRRVPARFATVLDEEETVRKIIEEKVWLPALRPAPARWLELALVVDASASMLVWHATVRELRLLFERLGAFRDVRVWTIDTAQRDRLTLRSPHAPGARPSAELRDTTGRRAIVVVSDCIAPAWDAALPPVLAEWARQQPVAILQLFPETLWRQTALAATHRVQLSAPAPGVPNAQLRATFPPGPPGWEKPKEPPIPVLTTEPAVLRAWAAMVARGGTSNVPAVVFEPEEKIEFADAVVDLPPERRIAAFQSNASATAFKLACLLAAAPLQLPVMRLVQQALLPGSRQVHLAEVFVSGLLERVTPPGEVRDPDLIEFAFHRGVGELLLGANRAWEMMAVLEKVSQYVNERFGSALDFQALVRDPRLIGDLPVVAGARPFASVAAKVLARFGGKYAQAAKKLRGRVVKESGVDEEERLREARGRKWPLENKWVLWADDHPKRNVAGHARLERERAHVVTARSTEEALAELSRRPFDAIITDLVRGTEEFAGFDLLERVRSIAEAPPVAIYTSVRGLAHERAAMEKGALILASDFGAIQQALTDHFSEKTTDGLAPWLTPEQTARLHDALVRTPRIAEFQEGMMRDPRHAGWRDFFGVAKNRANLATMACYFIASVFDNGCVQFWRIESGEDGGVILELEGSFTGRQTLRKQAGDGFWLQRAAQTHKAVYSADLSRMHREDCAVVTSRCALAVPIAVPSSPVQPPFAVLGLETPRAGAFPARQQEWIEALAESLGAAWQELPDGSEEKTTIDPVSKQIADEVRALPYPANFLVAARCVRRLEPLFALAGQTGVMERLKEFQNSIAFVLASIEGKTGVPELHSMMLQQTRAITDAPTPPDADVIFHLRRAGARLAMLPLALGELKSEPERFVDVFLEAFAASRRAAEANLLDRKTPAIVQEMVRADLPQAEALARLAWSGNLADADLPLWSESTALAVWPPSPSESARPTPRCWILVAGTGAPELPPPLAEACQLLGRLLAEAGYGLVCGGWPGVDAVVSRAFADACRQSGRDPKVWCEQVLEPEITGAEIVGGTVPADNGGVAIALSVDDADAAVLLAGSGATMAIGEEMRKAGKPVFPLAATGGDAAEFFRSNAQNPAPGFVRRDEFELLAEETSVAITMLFRVLLPRVAPRPPKQTSRVPVPLSLLRTHADHEGVILRVCWRPDGAQVATVGVDRRVCIRDVRSGERVALLQDHAHGVNSIAWSPDLRHYATCSFDRTINIYEAAENRRVAHLEGHIADIPSIAWSPAGDGLASCSADGSIVLWAAGRDRREWRQRVVFPNQGTTMHRVLWSLDGARLYSCSRERVIRVWSPEGEPLEALESHRGAVNDLALSRDGRWLASASADGTFRAWDLPVQSFVMKDRDVDDVRGISFSHDGLLLALNTGRPEGRIEIWRTDRWEQVYEMSEKPSNFWPCNIAWSPAAPILAVLGETDQVLKLWNVDGAALLGTDAS